MRDYDTDFEELYEKIEALEQEKKQRNKIPAKKRKNRKRTAVKDKDGTTTEVGNVHRRIGESTNY